MADVFATLRTRVRRSAASGTNETTSMKLASQPEGDTAVTIQSLGARE
jgi:hypothetical protein